MIVLRDEAAGKLVDRGHEHERLGAVGVPLEAVKCRHQLFAELDQQRARRALAVLRFGEREVELQGLAVSAAGRRRARNTPS